MLYLKKNNETQTAYISKNGNYEGKKTYKEGYNDGYTDGMDEGRNNPITTKEVYFSNGIKTSTHNVGVINFNVAIPTSPLKGSNYIETTFFPYWNNGCIFGLQSSSYYLAYIQNEKLYILLNNTNLVLERPCTYAKWHTLRIYTDRAVFDGEEVFYGETFETDDLMMACINRGGRGYYRGEIAYIKHTEDEQNTLMWVVPNPDANRRTLIRVRKDETGWSRVDDYLGILLQIATANLPISESVVFVEGGGVCPELTELNVTENGTYEGAYNVVNVNVEGDCNIEETRWVTPNTSDVDGSGYLVYHKSDGYDGMDRVALDMRLYNTEKYNEGYNDGLNAGGDCPELTELNVSENGTYEGAYNIVNVNVPTEGDSCNLGELNIEWDSGWNENHFYAENDGYDGYNSVNIDATTALKEKYDEGYDMATASLTELNVTENGTYTPPTISFLRLDGDDKYEMFYPNDFNAFEIKFKVNGSDDTIFLGQEGTEYDFIGLKACPNISTLYVNWYNKQINISNVDFSKWHTLVVKMLDENARVILDGEVYNNYIENTSYESNGSAVSVYGNIDLEHFSFWESWEEYNNGNTPFFDYKVSPEGLMRSFGGEYSLVDNIGGGVAQYLEEQFLGYNKVNVEVPQEGNITPSAVEKKFDTLAFRTENLHDGDIMEGMDKSKLEDYYGMSAEGYYIAYSQNKNSVVICEHGEFTSPSVSTIENGALDWNRIEYFHSFTIHTFGTDMTRDTGSNLLQLHLQGYGTIMEGSTNIIFKKGCFATSNRLNKIVFYAPYYIVVEDYAFEGVSNSGKVIVVGTDNSGNRAKYDVLMTQLGDGWTLTFTDSYNG